MLTEDEYLILYNKIVDIVEKDECDFVSSADQKWFILGYIRGLKDNNLITTDEAYRLLKELVQVEIL